MLKTFKYSIINDNEEENTLALIFISDLLADYMLIIYHYFCQSF